VPLIDTHADGVKAKIRASITPVEAKLDGKVDGVKTGVSARLAPTTQYVPLRLGKFPSTKGFRLDGNVYVDDGKNSYKMSLADIKDLNTKIVTTDSIDTVDKAKITVGDCIIVKKQD